MSGQTPSYGFELIDFNNIPWDQKDNARWLLLDRVLSLISLVPTIKGSWMNSTSYKAGDNVLDTQSLLFYTCMISHTSPATGNFAADRLADATRWQAVTQQGGVIRYDLQQTLDSASQARVRAAIGAAQAAGGGLVTQGGGSNQNNDAINIGGNVLGAGVRLARAGSDLGVLWQDGLAAKSFSDNGYQKFPSGFILQWGKATVSNFAAITYPIAFPTTALDPVISSTDAAAGSVISVATASNSNLTGFTANTRMVQSNAVSVGNVNVRWMVGGW